MNDKPKYVIKEKSSKNEQATTSELIKKDEIDKILPKRTRTADKKETIAQRLNRKARIPLYEQRRSKFNVNGLPDHVYRFVNDEGNRIEMFRKAGWKVVTSNNDEKSPENRSKWGDAVRRSINRGTEETILMETSKELYEFDQKKKLEKVDKIENAIVGLLEDQPALRDLRRAAYGSLNINISKNFDEDIDK